MDILFRDIYSLATFFYSPLLTFLMLLCYVFIMSPP